LEGEENGGERGKEEGGRMGLVTVSGMRWTNRSFRRRRRSHKRVIDRRTWKKKQAIGRRRGCGDGKPDAGKGQAGGRWVAGGKGELVRSFGMDTHLRTWKSRVEQMPILVQASEGDAPEGEDEEEGFHCACV